MSGGSILCELAAEEPKKLRLIAHWTGADFGPMFEYEAQGTPCAQVIEGRFCHFESGVQHLFPAEDVAGLPGMGIGLTVCQRLVEAMGGHIWAANIHGGGARFSFSLPALH